jgi:hypothetical protein
VASIPHNFSTVTGRISLMVKKSRVMAVVMLCSIPASGCQDLGTSTVEDARFSRSPARADGGATLLKSLYICNTAHQFRTSGHYYVYTRASLRFPTHELGAGGGTQEFRLRVRLPGQAPVAAANCRIPNTRAAAERMYRTFEHVFAHRAKMAPLDFKAREEERVVSLSKQGTQTAVPSGALFSTVPLDPIVVTAEPVYEGGATGWTGTTQWGWGSQGDGTTYTGGGDSPEPAPAPAVDGPILAVIVCLGTLLGVGYTIDDVADQAKQLLADKDAKEGAERMFEMYTEQDESIQNPAQRNLLYYIREQATAKYNDDIHQLAVKLKVSDLAIVMGVLACAGSLALPTP